MKVLVTGAFGNLGERVVRELQRQALLMFTSCGWFFHDLAGIETIQILRYAARAIDLLEELGDTPPTEAFLDVLDEARSNDHREGSGRIFGGEFLHQPGKEELALDRIGFAQGLTDSLLHDIRRNRQPVANPITTQEIEHRIVP